MRKKDIDKQLEQLKVQRELLKDAEVQFVEKQKQIEEEKRKEEEAKRKPYNVFGRDFSVMEPHIVQFYKNRMKMLVVQYKLVGGFNDDGVYVIPKEIKYDLIAMNKAIDDMGDDYYKVTALYMTKHFNFTIKLTMLDDGRARASLYIAEYVGSYAENETMYTFVADFVDVYDAEFRIKLRKVFNLYDVDVKNDDFTIPNIAVLLQDLYDIDKYVGGLYDMSAQIYVLRMLKLLESGGELGEEIIAEYKKLLLDLDEEKFGAKDDPTKRSKNEILKECLDKAIDDKGGLEVLIDDKNKTKEPAVDKKELNEVLEDVNKMDTAISDLKVGGIMEIDLPDKKEEKKDGKPSSAPAKKKSAKKTPKKEEKKPEKKKDKEKKKEEEKKGGGVTLAPSASSGGILEAIGEVVEGINEWIEEIKKPAPEKPEAPKPEERPRPEARPERPRPANPRPSPNRERPKTGGEEKPKTGGDGNAIKPKPAYSAFIDDEVEADSNKGKEGNNLFDGNEPEVEDMDGVEGYANLKQDLNNVPKQQLFDDNGLEFDR